MKRLAPFVLVLAWAGSTIPPAQAQPKASRTTAHVRVFEGPN
jgi:hypothetical protein